MSGAGITVHEPSASVAYSSTVERYSAMRPPAASGPFEPSRPATASFVPTSSAVHDVVRERRGWAGLRESIDRLRRVIKRRRKLAAADVVVVSHAKSGRTWLATMISHVYHQRCGIPESELIQFDNFHNFDNRVPRILFTHDNRKDAGKSPLFLPSDLCRQKVVLLVRHPCDIAVSSYFQSFRNARKGVGRGHEGRPIFDYVVEKKLPLVLAFLRRWRRQIEQIDQGLVVRYEDLRNRPEKELARILTFIEGRADPEEIKAAVDFASFEQMKQKEAASFFTSDKLRPGDPADPQTFKVRQGQVGGYRAHFTEPQIAQIDAMLADADVSAFGYGQGTPLAASEALRAPDEINKSAGDSTLVVPGNREV